MESNYPLLRTLKERTLFFVFGAAFAAFLTGAFFGVWICGAAFFTGDFFDAAFFAAAAFFTGGVGSSIFFETGVGGGTAASIRLTFWAMRFKALPALNQPICCSLNVWFSSISSTEPSACRTRIRTC